MLVRDAVFGVFFACLGLFMLITASGFPSFPGQPYGASLLPSVLGAGFLIVGPLLILRDLGRRRGGDRSAEPWIARDAALHTRSGIVAGLLVVGTALAHVLLSPHVGFIPVSIISLTALFLWFRVALLRALIIAVIGTAICWIVFAVVLKVPLARGPLEGLI